MLFKCIVPLAMRISILVLKTIITISLCCMQISSEKDRLFFRLFSPFLSYSMKNKCEKFEILEYLLSACNQTSCEIWVMRVQTIKYIEIGFFFNNIHLKGSFKMYNIVWFALNTCGRSILLQSRKCFSVNLTIETKCERNPTYEM